MSRAELAEAVCAWLWRTKSTRVPLDSHYIAKLERGAVRRTGSTYREGLRAVLDVPTDHELGMDREPTRARRSYSSSGSCPSSFSNHSMTSVDL
jgi:hypothetical protein